MKKVKWLAVRRLFQKSVCESASGVFLTPCKVVDKELSKKRPLRLSRDSKRHSLLEFSLLIIVLVSCPAEPPAVTKNTLNLELVEVQGSSFLMGSLPNEPDRDLDEEQHPVMVNDFIITKYEITFEQYDTYVTEINNQNEVPSPEDEGWGRKTRPVMNVNWYDAVKFCNWLSGKDNLTPAYTIDGTEVTCDWNADGWRLPTEAEWEYAARGGQNKRDFIYSGGNEIGDVAWYKENSDTDGKGVRSQPVGGRKINDLGIADMSGNVWEWCWDRYGNYNLEYEIDPTGPATDPGRVFRGGSYNHPSQSLRLANRSKAPADFSSSMSGFRLVRSADLWK